jgi:ADP-ribosylglycohydrolase
MHSVSLLDRYRGSLLGLAVGDALGTSLEFKAPGSFTPLHDLVGGGPFDLKPGEWTDDTSMALCLAESLIETGRFDAADQMQRYLRWWRTGRFSSHGHCFDIGNTVRSALELFEVTGVVYAGSTDPEKAGNGSIMRLAPVPLFFAKHRAEAVARAEESSLTTHGAPQARDACRVLAALIVGALQSRTKEELLGARFFETFVESAGTLNPAIAAITSGSFTRKQPPEIRGTGYVVESLEAALWAFAHSSSFAEGALKAVNLGDDADTTGAVYGQLAGAYYGLPGIPPEWRDRIAHRELIETFATRLFDHAVSPLGTRKHVLDMTSGRLVYKLNGLISAAGARLASGPPLRPLGYRHPDECSLPDFVNMCGLSRHFTQTLGEWNTADVRAPTWDLLGLLDVDSRPGLLLVEARTRLVDVDDDVESAVAAAYLVASCGLDAVLLFLGFTGDDYFPDHFRGPESFVAAVREHLTAVVPFEVVGQRVPHKSGGSMSILIGSLPVQEPSGRLSMEPL